MDEPISRKKKRAKTIKREKFIVRSLSTLTSQAAITGCIFGYDDKYHGKLTTTIYESGDMNSEWCTVKNERTIHQIPKLKDAENRAMRPMSNQSIRRRVVTLQEKLDDLEKQTGYGLICGLRFGSKFWIYKGLNSTKLSLNQDCIPDSCELTEQLPLQSSKDKKEKKELKSRMKQNTSSYSKIFVQRNKAMVEKLKIWLGGIPLDLEKEDEEYPDQTIQDLQIWLKNIPIEWQPKKVEEPVPKGEAINLVFMGDINDMLEIKQEVDEEPRSTAPDPLEIDFQTGEVNEQKHMQYLEVKEELIDHTTAQGPTGPENAQTIPNSGDELFQDTTRNAIKCFGCEFETMFPEALNDHMEKEHPPNSCGQCNYVTRDIKSFMDHIGNMHKGSKKVWRLMMPPIYP